ncbi:MAG TPA: hypothetical protein VFB57_06390 [Gaiellaceae bacterium]|jgi:hypothetical protein|nr:hypothetical protein [Gaiellaceae bacterium]
MAERGASAPSGWLTSESLGESGAVESRQWIALERLLVSPDAAGAVELGRRYLAEIGPFTRGLVTTKLASDETALLLGRAIPLLRFGAATTEVREDGVSCRFRITGGLLAARAGGSLTVEQRSAPRQLELAVVGYVPRLGTSRRRWSLRRLLYTSVQVRAHRAISRRFLEGAAEEARS